MNLYHMQYEHESYYVEAPSLRTAVDAWRKHVKKLWQGDWTGDEEPESIALVHEEAVIR